MTEHKPKSGEKKDVFLLGGKDLEMYQIEKRLRRAGKEFVTRNLEWGAKIDDYNDEVQKILEEGNTPVAVELGGADKIEGVVDIDHHNEKSGRPASIAQVMNRMGKPMKLVDEMVAANDSAYIPGMQAKMEEYRSQLVERYGEEKFEKLKVKLIELIRAKDRQMQGVTPEMESEAKTAVEHAEHGPDDLTIVTLNGGKPSPATDRLFQKMGKQNYVVVCNNGAAVRDVYYFGRGDVCKALKEKFASAVSWGGGTGYGDRNSYIAFGGAKSMNPNEVVKFIIDSYEQP
ncbi:hypothetical protein HY415_00195 [Candidatus Kaiserbacteria bacterium]|nr:hypothetical protein [Candidatus Kaiserbacteria bacterium]